MKFKVYYAKNPRFMGDKNLSKNDVINEITHAYVRTIDQPDLEGVFFNMQGEIWSPNGEANELIRSKGLFHTSMSVGDCAVDETGKIFQVEFIGWNEVK